MSLYPDILFHFTSKESLFHILSSTFKLSYARERFSGVQEERAFAVPMVSFCDLKLSQLKQFTKNYGTFGIGMKKEWANKHGLSPVMYLNRHCALADDLVQGLSGIHKHLDSLEDIDQLKDLSLSFNKILNTYRYIKNYEGLLERKGMKPIKDYRFADEREWRFVPSMNQAGVEPFVPISKIRTAKQKLVYNTKVDNIRLHFQPEDIKYLIVESEDDIIQLINHLEMVKGRFDLDTRKRLSSRILTIEQIRNDV